MSTGDPRLLGNGATTGTVETAATAAVEVAVAVVVEVAVTGAVEIAGNEGTGV
jgi:hypothetical protein